MPWKLFFGCCLIVHGAYWAALARGFRRAEAQDANLRRRTATDNPPPCSVVVAARDEADALPALFEALARQTHPGFEVVIADDASADATPEVVQRQAARQANVRHIRIAEPRPPRKKHALTQGIDAARHRLLAFTDADCAPPPRWLAALARRHAAAPAGTLFIGYSPYRHRPDLLCRMARYETFVAGFFTAAAAGLERPYMAVGRNISYPKTLFLQVGGFAHARQSLSGDDDLFVQHVYSQGAAPVHHVFGWATYVWTDAPASWRAWLRQKRRHASAGRFYARYARRHLTLFHATGLALWAAPFLAGRPGGALLAAKLLGQRFALRRAARTLGEADLLPALPLWELGYALYHLAVVPLGLLCLPKRW